MHHNLIEYKKDFNDVISFDLYVDIDLNRTCHGAIYFDSPTQEEDHRDELNYIDFHYTLSQRAASNYTIYALVLHEKRVFADFKQDEAILRD